MKHKLLGNKTVGGTLHDVTTQLQISLPIAHQPTFHSARRNYLETRLAKFDSGPRASHSDLRQFCKPRFQIISSARSVIYNRIYLQGVKKPLKDVKVHDFITGHPMLLM